MNKRTKIRKLALGRLAFVRLFIKRDETTRHALTLEHKRWYVGVHFGRTDHADD